MAAILKHLTARCHNGGGVHGGAPRADGAARAAEGTRWGLLTNVGGRAAASDAITKLDDALKQLAAVPVAKAPAPGAAKGPRAGRHRRPRRRLRLGAGAGDAAQGRRDLRDAQPDEAREVDNLLAKHAGREDELVRGSKKYAAQLAAPGPRHRRAAPAVHRRRRNPSPSPPRPSAASLIDDHFQAPQSPSRGPQKKVGAAVNSVGNDCASALKCAETPSDLGTRSVKDQGPVEPLRCVGGGSASQPLHVAHGGALQQCGVDDGTVSRFAAHLACDKLLEKLTGETFDRRKDVWALAACVCEFVAKDTTSFRRELFQAKLRDASPASLSKPAEGPDASKTAALCAALCIVDTPSMQGHPFGGLGAAWCWLRAPPTTNRGGRRCITAVGGLPGDGGTRLLKAAGGPPASCAVHGGVGRRRRAARPRTWRRRAWDHGGACPAVVAVPGTHAFPGAGLRALCFRSSAFGPDVAAFSRSGACGRLCRHAAPALAPGAERRSDQPAAWVI